jgi:imidazole glycerol-phosphate synthase subunit HisH
MIGIVDHGMGNRRSVEKALEHVGAAPRLTADHDTLRAADALVVPGVGAFPEAMRRLRAAGLDELIAGRHRDGVPILGVCLGMQLLFEHSEEHEGAEGLGLLEGRVRRMDTRGERLPHIGWNLVTFRRPSPLTDGLGEAAAFYHVHSFVCEPERLEDIVGVGEYGVPFVSVVERGNAMGVQFHPEKSSRDGLALLRNFTRLGVSRAVAGTEREAGT